MKKIASLLLTILLSAFTVTVVKAEVATSSADSIREKVQEKVTKALNSPKAYIGTVTDISSATLQIRKYSLAGGEKNGEIQQVATASDTIAVSVGKTTKTIKVSEIAIGDFIVAMGYKNGNNVLDAKRILVTEALKPSTRSTVLAKVTKVMKNTLEATTTQNEKLTIEQEDGISLLSQTDGKQTKIKFADIENGDSIIAFGTLNGKIFSARKIVVVVAISQTPTPTSSPKASPTPSVKPTITPKPTP